MEHKLSITGKSSGALLQSIMGNFKSIRGTSLASYIGSYIITF